MLVTSGSPDQIEGLDPKISTEMANVDTLTAEVGNCTREHAAKVKIESSTHYRGVDSWERKDAGEELLELERCLWEEIDEMSSSSNDSTNLDVGETDYEDPYEGPREKGTNSEAGGNGDASSASEWLQFLCSAQGVARYMETATADIQGVSKLLAFSASENQKILSNDLVCYAEDCHHAGGEECHTSPARSSDSSKPITVSKGDGDKGTIYKVPTTVLTHPYSPEHFTSVVWKADMSAFEKYGVCSTQKVKVGDSLVVAHLPVEERPSKTNETGNTNTMLSTRGVNSVDSAKTKSEDLFEEPIQLESYADRIPSIMAFKEREIKRFPRSTERWCPTPPIQESGPRRPMTSKQTSLIMNSVCNNQHARTTMTSIEAHLATTRSLGTDRRRSRQQEQKIEQQSEKMCQVIECRTSGNVNTVNMMASLGEAEVARRIKHATEQELERRQRWREERSQRIKRDRSIVIIQAIWRKRRALAAFAPTRKACRREAVERRFMFEEENITEIIVALEAERKEVEKRHISQELCMMRSEEKMTRRAWVYLLWLEKTAMQEELARMRAEERSTRALVELELEAVRHSNAIRREKEEAVAMMSEDATTRAFIHLEKAEIIERDAMGLEDVLSNNREGMERRQQAIAKVEVSQMMTENISNLTLSIGYHSARERIRRTVLAKSTPIQRAMDHRGVIAARRLLLDNTTCFGHNVAKGGHDEATSISSAHAERSDARSLLILERARRRELYRSHLDNILAKSRESWHVHDSNIPTEALRGEIDHGIQGNTSYLATGGVGVRQSHFSASSPRTSSAENNDTEYVLTADMLSHLEPLQTLASLELCVEGLTSTRLLKACTSLKALSLNVNRLSSPEDLVMCTALVRLGLRDNRLSSLEGLAGMPNLRELRLDINHLSSFHELKSLPALVELSINTNHIKELPEGFASGLMSPLPSSGLQTLKSIQQRSSSAAQSTLPHCALQKLELYHNRIAFIRPRALDGLGSLTHLDLGRNKLRSLDGRVMETCPALSTLVLSQNYLRKPPCSLRLPLLTEFWLSGNQISTMGEWVVGPPESFTFPYLMSHLEERLECSKMKQGKNNEPLFLKGGKHEAKGFVWLPSLVVLHLEDNVLESLGGRWSLAGCPLLRSLDISFNRLSSPADFGPCLSACGELEEIRLHDNPVVESGMCTNIVALNCSKVVRIDGVSVDRQAHWRAGAKAYSRRSDLVFPYLDQSAQECDFRVDGGNAGALSPNDQQTVANNTSHIPVESIEECLWCGATKPSVTKSMERDVRCSQEGDNYVNTSRTNSIPRGEGDKDECNQVAPPQMEAYQATVKTVSHARQKDACGACGLVPPDANMWRSASDTPDDKPALEWSGVLSAGHRWRYNFPTDLKTIGSSVDANDEETKRANLFQEACRWGYNERAQMRRRHRREERNLKSVTSVLGDTAPTKTAEKGDEVRPALAAPSIRKLELELELAEKHARERRDITTRLLRLHGSDGIEHTDIQHSENEQCIIMDLRQSVLARSMSAVARSRRNASKVEITSNNLLRNRAACIIQYRWHRRQEKDNTPLGSPSRPHLDSGVTRPANHRAVTTLQSAFRGFHVRRVLKAALDSARYVDDELEGLLNVNGGARFELDRFLSPPPELAESWMGSGTAIQCFDEGNSSRRVRAPNGLFVAAARAVINNTPRHSNTVIGQTDDTRGAGHLSTNVGINIARSREHVAGGAQASPLRVAKAKTSNLLNKMIEEGLDRAHSTNAIAKARGIGKSGPVGARPGGNVTVEDMNCGGNGPGEDGVVHEIAGKDLIEAWGLKDPRVAGMMMKRINRLRKFSTSEARRAKMRDPEARFEVFSKRAGAYRQARPVNFTNRTQEMIKSSESDQAHESDTQRSGVSEAGTEHESQGESSQLAPIVTAWTGRGRCDVFPRVV